MEKARIHVRIILKITTVEVYSAIRTFILSAVVQIFILVVARLLKILKTNISTNRFIKIFNETKFTFDRHLKTNSSSTTIVYFILYLYV